METAVVRSRAKAVHEPRPCKVDTLTNFFERIASDFQETSLGKTTNVFRRQKDRTALPYLLQLTPLDDQGHPMTEEESVVVGRDFSTCGLSFFHSQPIPNRRAQISLNHPQSGRFTVEIQIRRCRFHRLGWYESNARLVRAVEFMLPTNSYTGN
jgi:hypothetical protein